MVIPLNIGMIYLSETLTHIIDQPVSVILTWVALDIREVRKVVERLLWEQQTEWNKLSVDLKRSTSVKNFKRPLFKIILNNQILTQLFM